MTPILAYDWLAPKLQSDERKALEVIYTALNNQASVVKASHAVSGRIKSAAIKLGYDPATATITELDCIIQFAQSAPKE